MNGSKYRRQTATKAKQITSMTIDQLILQAKSEGLETEQDIACWIIDHSAWWRSEGYEKIIAHMRKEQHDSR